MNNETENKPVNQGRRRLAQGGLAGSIVLASLISKHALASAVPYNCTKSGKFSGTNSTYGPPSASECKLGMSESQWETKLAGPPEDKKTFVSTFDVDDFYYSLLTNTLVNQPITGNQDKPATLYQVLAANPGGFDLEKYQLAKRAIVLYLNAEMNFDNLSAYPLTRTDVTSMFVCAYGGVGPCSVGTQALGPTSWTSEDVREYFKLLSP